eukprot:TRINITY_DN1689_c0_g3_i1.p1 TRINITY_DN1689_c0_g3~~TRINITY_DN1689_c0_g3_i1.p1  ORF type:complete len:369 (+),score=92.50 TRINITY_DN1689_c0_g3_i1:511-1617(+)
MATGSILRLFAVSPHEASLGQTFARYYALSLPPSIGFASVDLYLQAQEIVAPGVVCNLLSIFVSLACNYVLVFGAFGWGGLGFIGSPLATTAAAVFKLVVYVWYVFAWKKLHRRCWAPWSRAAFTRDRLREYVVQNSLSSAFAAMFEEYQMLVVGFMAVKLGKDPLAAHNAMLQVFTVLTSIVYGSMTALTVRTAKHLGAGAVESAKRATAVGSAQVSIVGVLAAVLFLTLRNEVGKIFTSDKKVLALTSDLSLLCALCYPALAAFFACCASLAGQCKYAAPGLAFFVGGWVVAIPTAWLLGFHFPNGLFGWGGGLVGLWEGLVLGYTVCTVIVTVCVLRTDWQRQSELAQQRSKNNDGAPHAHSDSV